MTKFSAIETPYLAALDGSFSLSDYATDAGGDNPGKKECKKALAEEVERLADLQRILYADDRYSVLCVFQAMDAAGKDSTIRAVFSGVNPAGFQVSSFKRPSSNELEQDFLWRTAKALPQRGRIGVFNRSYYEEVLVVKVHPGILDGQRLPDDVSVEERFEQRYASLREHEAHLARNGTIVLKFFLNVSLDEQARRFLARLNDPAKHWKFAGGDMRERGHWAKYMEAYEKAIQETSRPGAPWYAIPADDKAYMRWQVAKTLRQTLESLPLRFPEVEADEAEDFDRYRAELEAELGK